MSEMMMTAGFDEMVRTRAYALWESEGRPLGRDAEHWLQSEEEARRELRRTAPVKAPSQPKAKAASAKKVSTKRTAMAAGMPALA
jgi:Protein of unknown function (DUF2934)